MIYVDEINHYPNCKWRYKYFCHMWTDGTIHELNEMADKLGLKRSWPQTRNRDFIHYDITPTKRRLAIKNGAKVKSLYEHVREQLYQKLGTKITIDTKSGIESATPIE